MDSGLLRREIELQVLPTPPRVIRPGTPAAEGLLPWLDAGLRGSRPGRIGDEYRAVLGEPTTEHVAIHAGNRPVSHALSRLCTVEAEGRSLRVGMIGLVYTDPAHRRAGLAARCIETAIERLAGHGADVTVLWSDQPGYYERLGFLPAARERLIRVDVAACRATLRRSAAELRVTPPRPEDWPTLDALYAAKPVRVTRAPGRLAELAEAPDCELVVCRDGRGPAAYAALGKGDDFRAVVHEWAGSAEGVLACLCALLDTEPGGLLLAGPRPEPITEALLDLDAPVLERPFALLHLTDAEGVFSALAGEHPQLAGATLRREAQGFRLGLPGREVLLEPRQGMQLLFGPELPPDVLEPLDADVQRAIRERLPWPLFVWGFDSI